MIVTIGITPTRPETGFGYLELGGAGAGAPRRGARCARFVEKPDRATAERYLASGRYLWNAGMFFVSRAPAPRRARGATCRRPRAGVARDIAAGQRRAPTDGVPGACRRSRSTTA